MNCIKVGVGSFGEWPRQAYLPVRKDLGRVEILALAAKSAATQQYLSWEGD